MKVLRTAQNRMDCCLPQSGNQTASPRCEARLRKRGQAVSEGPVAMLLSSSCSNKGRRSCSMGTFARPATSSAQAERHVNAADTLKAMQCYKSRCARNNVLLLANLLFPLCVWSLLYYDPLGGPILLSTSGTHIACQRARRAFHGTIPSIYRCTKAPTCLMLQMEGRGRCQLDPVVSINQAGQNYTNRIVPAAADGKEQRAGCRARRDRWLASMRRHPCIQGRGLTGPGLRAAAHGRVIRYMLTCINTLLL